MFSIARVVRTGMPAIRPEDKGLSFKDLNALLSSCEEGKARLFTLVNDKSYYERAATDVFTLQEGVWLMHSYYFHPEDAEYDDAEPIHHCVVYNAGTRVLFLYPEVCCRYAHDFF